MLPDLWRMPYFGLDTESTGLNYPINYAFCVGLAAPNGDTWCIDFRTDPHLLDWLQDQFNRCKNPIIMHNASFDVKMLAATGCNMPLALADDTVIRAVQINEHLSSKFPWTKRHPTGYSLDSVAGKYIGARKMPDIVEKLAAELGGRATKNVQMGQIVKGSAALISEYVRSDALLALRLWEWQEEEIERQGIQKICDFERKLMPTLIRAEMRGIDVDVEYAAEAVDKLTIVRDRIQGEINHLAGFELNVNSSKQIQKVFKPIEVGDKWFSSSGFLLGTTPKGAPSVGADVLRVMSDPIAAKIVELRSVIKTKDTFLLKNVIQGNFNGIVYPSINQTKGEAAGGGTAGTGTGRLSYTGPAMQQIPNRNKEVAAIVKPAFRPPPGMVWVDSDLASFEVRIFAHLVGAYNAALVQAYEADPTTDFHQYVADLTGLPRNASYAGEPNAKQLNLSMIFNSGNGAIADKIGLPYTEESFDTVEYGEPKHVEYKKAGLAASEVIKEYHRKIPGVKKLAERAAAVANSRGFVRTGYGRTLRFPKGYKAYKASGLLIQATSADINKENWMLIEEALGNDGHIILNTHDSYSMAMPEDWEPVYERVREAVEQGDRAISLRVPILLDLNGAGKNWWEAIKEE